MKEKEKEEESLATKTTSNGNPTIINLNNEQKVRKII